MKKIIFILLVATMFTGCKKDDPVLDPIVEKVYTKIVINSITLTNYQLTDNGDSWDISSGLPDIYISILNVNPTNTVLYKHPVYFVNVVGVKNLDFNISGGLTLPIINDFYFLDIFDDDSPLSPDLMGYISFNPSVYTDHPASFSKTQNGCTATFNVTWQ